MNSKQSPAPSSDTLLRRIEPQIQALGYDLVDVEFQPGIHAVLRVFIDREATGITLDDCERVSRALSAWLDVEDPVPGRYSLEISSPGVDRVLRTPEHFARFLGATVKVGLKMPLDGRRRFRGELVRLDGENVVVQVDGVEYSLPLVQIDKARIAPG